METPPRETLLRTLRAKWPLIALLVTLGALTLPTACSGNSALPSIGSGGTAGTTGGQCTDADGDGYGDGCTLGADCNDSDPTITNQCYLCVKPHTGCSCDTAGARASCGQVESTVADQVTCGYGEMVCAGGVWGECIVNNSVTLLPGGDPKQHTAGLGAPGSCAANPCDPYCQTWNDTSGGLTPDGGVVVTEGGVTIPLGDSGAVDGGTDGSGGSGGATCSGGSVGSCSHHICTTGGALTPGCDSPTPTCTAKGSACPGSSPCCYGLTCQAGVCKEPAVSSANFTEDFNPGSGWSTSGNWDIGPAVGGNGDPANDTSPGADNRLAGTVIGGHYSNSHDDSLISSTIDTSGSGALTLTLQSWEDFEPTYDFGRIYVSTNAGVTWTQIYATSNNGGGWNALSFDISAYHSNLFKLRFRLTSDSSVRYGGWSIDDIAITGAATTPVCHATGGTCSATQSCCNNTSCIAGVCATPAPTSCVTSVCATKPSCCAGAWDASCVNAIATACGGASCAMNTTGQCVFCFADSMDHDGDGYSYAQGDCKDCDATINPGAYDFPGDGLDQDCNGTVDDGITGCDTGLAFTSANPDDYARAMELCRFTTAGATGASKTWGVISATLAQADGSACSDSLQRAITSQFGSGNPPRSGAKMDVFSSGTARAPGDPGYINPSGQVGSYNAGTNATPPPGFPRSAAGCPNGSAAHDSCGLKLQVRAPTNALSFAYDFHFFSTEYPEWVCTAYNDTFVSIYNGALNPYADKNISFDANNNPVSVNVGFFGIPGSPTTTTHPLLNGTGFDGTCNNSYAGASYTGTGVCGGSTGWLTTTAPVNPGETVTLQFIIWDTGDHVWDSTVLMDNFRWSPATATITTQPVGGGTPPPPPPPPPPTYSEGSFSRDYDGTTACPAGTVPVWGSWSWTSTTPSDSQIQFFVKTADTQAGLASATEYPLQFTNPPGPSGLAGTPLVAKTSPTDTQNGSAVVDTVLGALSVPRNLHFVSVRSRLMPSTDKLSAPMLNAWNLEVSCRPAE